MTCSDFEKLIALDVEGDLPKQSAADVAGHVRTCPRCREFAEELQASQALLKELRLEEPDEAALQGIRRGILNRLPDKAAATMFPPWQFALGAGLAAILILAVVMFWHMSRTPAPKIVAERDVPTSPSRHGDRNQTTTPAPVGPGLAPAKAAPGGGPTTRRVVKTREYSPGSLSASAKRPPEPLTLKLMTDNPNVVIYWLVD